MYYSYYTFYYSDHFKTGEWHSCRLNSLDSFCTLVEGSFDETWFLVDDHKRVVTYDPRLDLDNIPSCFDIPSRFFVL